MHRPVKVCISSASAAASLSAASALPHSGASSHSSHAALAVPSTPFEVASSASSATSITASAAAASTSAAAASTSAAAASTSAANPCGAAVCSFPGLGDRGCGLVSIAAAASRSSPTPDSTSPAASADADDSGAGIGEEGGSRCPSSPACTLAASCCAACALAASCCAVLSSGLVRKKAAKGTTPRAATPIVPRALVDRSGSDGSVGSVGSAGIVGSDGSDGSDGRAAISHPRRERSTMAGDPTRGEAMASDRSGAGVATDASTVPTVSPVGISLSALGLVASSGRSVPLDGCVLPTAGTLARSRVGEASICEPSASVGATPFVPLVASKELASSDPVVGRGLPSMVALVSPRVEGESGLGLMASTSLDSAGAASLGSLQPPMLPSSASFPAPSPRKTPAAELIRARRFLSTSMLSK